jgi:multidrug efflux pump subunit AcrA (membrane-fusion protein)
MLDAIHVREGESVGTNQLLAELDTERLEAIRKEAEAQLLEAQAALKLAKATPSAPNRRKS